MITIRDRQTLLDIALRECGDAKAVWDIAVMSGVSITDTNGEIDIPNIIDKRVVGYYATNNIHPATGELEIEMRVLALDDVPININNKMIVI